jgi:hypothetical protein
MEATGKVVGQQKTVGVGMPEQRTKALARLVR